MSAALAANPPINRYRNIFLTRKGRRADYIKVLDFGLAKAIEETSIEQLHLTQEGSVPGTPAFLAPEVTTGRSEVDARSDLYALGCVGYWLVTGQTVFEANSAVEMAAAHIQQQPLPPSARAETEVSTQFDDLILLCLEKDPADRPKDARQLLDRLAALDGSRGWSQADAEHWWSLHAPAAEPMIKRHPDETQRILRPQGK